jgi:hypothetical protein
MAIGFVVPEPMWGMPTPDIDLSEWIDEDDE